MPHQAEDSERLLGMPYALIASEMRTGKTKTVIDAAHVLFERNEVDNVVVVAPKPVVDVWADRRLGELAKHGWRDFDADVIEYGAGKLRAWNTLGISLVSSRRRLTWTITNYEYIVSDKNLEQLFASCDVRTLLVLDESAYVKNWRSGRTEACKELRARCGRAWLLNGTPIFHSPLDLFAQGNLLHKSVLDCPYVTHFKARYAVQEVVRGAGGRALTDPRGNVIKKVVSWTNLDDLQRRFAPYTIRRLQRDCIRATKLEPVATTATLKAKTWQQYKDMRDGMVVWLNENTVVSPATAAVKVMRLAQITSGVLSGVEEALPEVADVPGLWGGDDGQNGEGVLDPAGDPGADADPADAVRSVEVGREKLDACVAFMRSKLEVDPNFKAAFFCRFRPEAQRLAAELKERFPELKAELLIGGMKRADKLRAMALVKPETAPEGPAAIVSTFGTGSYGLDFSACHACVNVSPIYSPGLHNQSMDRAFGPGQTRALAYYDVVAVGPKGQRTIDVAIVEARRAGDDVAQWTASAWVKAIGD